MPLSVGQSVSQIFELPLAQNHGGGLDDITVSIKICSNFYYISKAKIYPRQKKSLFGKIEFIHSTIKMYSIYGIILILNTFQRTLFAYFFFKIK